MKDVFYNAFEDELEKIAVGKFKKGVAAGTLALSTFLPVSKAHAPAAPKKPPVVHAKPAKQIEDYSLEALEKKTKGVKPKSISQVIRESKQHLRRLDPTIEGLRKRVRQLGADQEAAKSWEAKARKRIKEGKGEKIEDFDKALKEMEKGGSVKGVVKKTMLAAALTSGLGGGVKALQSRTSAKAHEKMMSEEGKSKAWGRILGRKEQAKHQLGLVKGKQQKALDKIKAMSEDPKFKFSDPRDRERAISHAKHIDVLSKKRGKLKGELKEHRTAHKVRASLIPKGRMFISQERKLGTNRKRWGSRAGY